MILQLIAFFLLAPAAFAAFYYMFLAIVAFQAKKQTNINVEKSKCDNNFAIIIPAHNEEETIIKTLNSCKSIDYPDDKVTVFVIADNCNDNTANIVVDHGFQVLVRVSEKLIGKGHAITWAFKKLLPQSFDAFVIIDADCTIDSHSLKVFDYYLLEGALALQTNNVSSNPDDSAMSYAVSVGNIMENDLFYMPKDRLGLPIQLRGTGMVFAREILESFHWNSESIVEDMEYSLKLFKNNVSVRYVKEAKVSSEFPAHKKQLHVQRNRWAGNLGFGKKEAVKLLLQGLVHGPRSLIDVGWSFLVLSRPLVLAELFLTILLCVLCLIFVPGRTSLMLVISAVLVVGVQSVYFGIGMFLLGLSKKRIRFLIQAPFVILRLVIISLKGMFGFDRNSWSRTPRDN